MVHTSFELSSVNKLTLLLSKIGLRPPKERGHLDLLIEKTLQRHDQFGERRDAFLFQRRPLLIARGAVSISYLVGTGKTIFAVVGISGLNSPSTHCPPTKGVGFGKIFQRVS